jgi:hypothetical protein
MTAVPRAEPVAMPVEEPIAATVELLLLQVPPVVLLLNAALWP